MCIRDSTYSSATSIHEELHGPLSPRELKPPSRHSPPRVCTLHVPYARMLIICFVMLHSVQPSLGRKQGTLRATDHGLLADCSSGNAMQAPSRRHDPPEPRWYDPQHTLRVPTQPWTTGDQLRADRVHLDIYISGHAYWGSAWNPMANNGQGGWRVLDGLIDLDREYQITDPGQKHGGYLWGYPHKNVHDGNCGGTRYFTATRGNIGELRRAMSRCCELVCEAVALAKSRSRVRVDSKTDRSGFVETFIGHIGAPCWHGRHRGPIAGNEMARYARSRGCTVMLHYESLWDGVEDKHGNIDNRGPCGCHHGAAYCKFHQNDNPVEWANWLQTMANIF